VPIGGRPTGSPSVETATVRPTDDEDKRARIESMTTTTAALSHRRPAWRRPRLLGVLAAAVLIAGATFAWGALRPVVTVTPAKPATAAPGVSGDGTEPATAGVPGDGSGLPAAGSIAQIDHSIAAWTKNLAANPHDFVSATNLAVLYHGRGRLSADLGDQQKALDAARTAIAIIPDDPGPKALEATIDYTLHDFTGAFTITDAIVRADATQIGALATRLDAEIELGRIADARKDLATLSAATSGPAIDVRAARLAYVTGDAARALSLSRSALSAASADDETDLGFYDYAVGEYGRFTGDVAAARSAYTDALAARDTDIASLVGLARIDAFEGRTAAAIAGLEKAAAIAPQPETLALLGDLETATGDTAGATTAFKTVRFVKGLGQIDSSVFDRVLMRFELDHGGATEALLARARASLGARPDYTGHDTVAWGLYRLGRFAEAAAEIKAAGADGAADGRVLFHAGAIALATGDTSAGRKDLERALGLGPALDPIERLEASRLLAN
jgi:tetratricopeptide (TPR) repeat protein